MIFFAPVFFCLLGLSAATIPYFDLIPPDMMEFIIATVETINNNESAREFVRVELASCGIDVDKGADVACQIASKLLSTGYDGDYTGLTPAKGPPKRRGKKGKRSRRKEAARHDDSSYEPSTPGFIDHEHYNSHTYITEPNPFKSLESMQAFVRDPRNLPEIWQWMGKCDLLDDSSILVCLMVAAIKANAMDVFSSIEDCVKLPKLPPQLRDKLLKAATEPNTSPTYLDSMLCRSRCTPELANIIYSRLAVSNAPLHQVFANRCGSLISRSMGCQLVNVDVPQGLHDYWHDSGDLIDAKQGLFKMDRLNPTGSDDQSDVVEWHVNGNVEIYAIFGRSGQAMPWAHLTSLEQLQARLERMAKVAEVQRRFAVLYVDRESDKVVLFKSCNPASPTFIFTIQDNQNFHSTDASVLLVNHFHLRNGELIVGLPQSIMSEIVADPEVMQGTLAAARTVDEVPMLIKGIPTLLEFESKCPLLVTRVNQTVQNFSTGFGSGESEKHNSGSELGTWS